MYREVVIIFGCFNYSGVPRHMANLSNALINSGYNVSIVVTEEIIQPTPPLNPKVNVFFLPDYVKTNKEKQIKFLRRRQLNIKRKKRLQYFTKYFSKINYKLSRAVRGLRLSEDLSLFFAGHNHSIVICAGIRYLYEAYYATQKLDCKLVYAEMISPQWKYKNDAEGLEQARFLISKTEAAIYQTYDILSFYGEHLCKNECVIRNPIKELPLPYYGQRNHQIVNFCRINGQKDNQKNLMLTVKAFNRLVQDYPQYTLCLYGYVADVCQKNEDDFKYQIQALGLDHNIELFPPDVDVHSKILKSAMFVSSSDFEGLSNSMLEAMALGLPCVCTDCLGGGAREMIQNGENGLLVPMRDEEALYLAMKKMIEDPELADKCGKNAAKIREKLSQEKIIQQWINTIQLVRG